MFNINDFRCMHQGRQIAHLTARETVWMKPTQYESGRKSTALLALHGFSSSPAVFREMLPGFSSYDGVFIPTLPGHGENLACFSQVRAADWLEFAEELCQQLTSEYEQVDVLGLSLGGLISTHLSHLYPIRHLYLLAPAFDLQLRLSKLLTLTKLLDRLGFASVRNAAGNISHSEHYEIAYSQLPIPTVIQILTLIKTYAFLAPPCPTDVFLGKQDKVVSSTAIARRFKGVNQVKIHWLEGSAHVIPLDKDIDKILACMQKNYRENKKL